MSTSAVPAPDRRVVTTLDRLPVARRALLMALKSGDEADQQAPEAQPIGYSGALAAQWV